MVPPTCTLTDCAGAVELLKFASPRYSAVMLWVPVAVYATVHVVIADGPCFVSGWPTQDEIACPLSKNRTDPDGMTRPPWSGVTVAVNVARTPTITVGNALREVDVES